MSSQIFRTHSEEETIALGRSLAPSLSGVVLLIGNLGAGKTTIAKGIVEGRGGSADEVTSPTYTLIHQYSPELFHIDLYRLDEQREAETLGLDEIFHAASLVLLEWGERFPSLLPKKRTQIRLTALEDGVREIQISKEA